MAEPPEPDPGELTDLVRAALRREPVVPVDPAHREAAIREVVARISEEDAAEAPDDGPAGETPDDEGHPPAWPADPSDAGVLDDLDAWAGPDDHDLPTGTDDGFDPGDADGL